MSFLENKALTTIGQYDAVLGCGDAAAPSPEQGVDERTGIAIFVDNAKMRCRRTPLTAIIIPLLIYPMSS